MQTVEIVDYGPHIIQTKNLIRDIYDNLNNGQKEQAQELVFQLLAESKLLLNTIKHP